MESKNVITTIKTAILFFLLSALLVYIIHIKSQEPQIGEVWRYTTHAGQNPFMKPLSLKPYYDYKVLDVKFGYVLYRNLSDSTIESLSIRLFKVGAYRLNN
jgi:hypothetical protein